MGSAGARSRAWPARAAVGAGSSRRPGGPAGCRQRCRAGLRVPRIRPQGSGAGRGGRWHLCDGRPVWGDEPRARHPWHGAEPVPAVGASARRRGCGQQAAGCARRARGGAEACTPSPGRASPRPCGRCRRRRCCRRRGAPGRGRAPGPRGLSPEVRCTPACACAATAPPPRPASGSPTAPHTPPPAAPGYVESLALPEAAEGSSSTASQDGGSGVSVWIPVVAAVAGCLVLVAAGESAWGAASWPLGPMPRRTAFL